MNFQKVHKARLEHIVFEDGALIRSKRKTNTTKITFFISP